MFFLDDVLAGPLALRTVPPSGVNSAGEEPVQTDVKLEDPSVGIRDPMANLLETSHQIRAVALREISLLLDISIESTEGRWSR